MVDSKVTSYSYNLINEEKRMNEQANMKKGDFCLKNVNFEFKNRAQHLKIKVSNA